VHELVGVKIIGVGKQPLRVEYGWIISCLGCKCHIPAETKRYRRWREAEMLDPYIQAVFPFRNEPVPRCIASAAYVDFEGIDGIVAEL